MRKKKKKKTLKAKANLENQICEIEEKTPRRHKLK